MRACAILAFFSPCEYRLPQRHLASTVNWLHDAGISTIVAQAHFPGQKPQYVPPSATSLTFETEDSMFYKENLWNLAARACDHDALFFFDADVVMSTKQWFPRSLDLMETCGVIQPFELATWLNKDGNYHFSRPPSALALARGEEPSASKYHPGFAWGMTREAFDSLGGWYDKHPAGGADTAFTYALHDSDWPCRFLDRSFWDAPSYVKYRKNALKQGIRVGVTEGVSARHLWHGYWKDRGYVSRDALFRTQKNGEYPVKYRQDGLLVWKAKKHNADAMKYFASRKEDG